MKSSTFGNVLQAIIGGADIAIASTTSSIQYNMAKDTAKKIGAMTAQTLQEQEELKNKELAAKQADLSKKGLLARIQDLGTEKLVILSIGTLLGVTVLGLGILYKVR